MHNKLLKSLAFVSASVVATSCSLFSKRVYNWLESTKENTEINYCLLIGQNDHSDSIERTRGTREAFNTRDESTEVNNNANLGVPKEGYIDLPGNSDLGVDPKHFIVHELEHMEQKSLAGATWDPITANGTTATWICKHGKNISLFVSNNDSMAEGATMACNWIKGLPIFGYDANSPVLKQIKEGSIMGTMDQDASGQAGTALRIIRNIIDDQKERYCSKEISKIGTEQYNPTWRGFVGAGEEETDPDEYGYVCADITNQIKGDSHAALLQNIKVGTDIIDQFVNEDGSIKTAKELCDIYTKFNPKTEIDKTKTIHLCHVYNNQAEVYLKSNMMPYYDIYGPRLDFDIHVIDGDGVDETKILNQISSSSINFDAYLINMVTTTDADTFVKAIAEKVGKQKDIAIPSGGWDNFNDRLDVPLLFWNKQPQKVDGTLDTDNMNNKYFKYTYYVGVDAADGGTKQGELIKEYLNQRYVESVLDQRGR